ncbi:MAG: type II toxin-antitoxin system VapC family toxin [Gammaproteobacteria bacterium]|nr:type II toxin-antitoxin system VapC family toxin [Gammaproteobacteria bacterium]
MAVIKILPDTNAYTAFKRGHAEVREIFRHAHTRALNSVVLGELRAGFAAGSKEEWNLNELQAFLARPRVPRLSHKNRLIFFNRLCVILGRFMTP